MAYRNFEKLPENGYLQCPECESESSKVIECRINKNGKRRRRECTECGFRFSTEEIPKTLFLSMRYEIAELKKDKEALSKSLEILQTQQGEM